MAVVPNFIFGPSAILSLVGLLQGPDTTVPTPPEDWREARVDVVIPALNEESNIVFCLESVARQTLKPHRIILVDDGSSDRTQKAARAFCAFRGLDLTVIPRVNPIGKTPTIKRQSREFDGDVEFILDADTILESPEYISRTVEELFKARGIASASGRLAPFRAKDRRVWMAREGIRDFREAHPDLKGWQPEGGFARLLQGAANVYRSALHTFVQRFIHRGQMSQYGSILTPAGCAVAYRRRYIKDLFDHYEPIFGDDLTKAEDIFMGLALLNEGYRNIQLEDITARSQEPTLLELPIQMHRWTSSFFRSCADFGGLVVSPFKGPKRWNHERRVRASGVMEKRMIREPYRQCWGREYTSRFGRPIGWAVMASVLEKLAWPVALAVFVGLRLWKPLLLTIGVESLLTLLILFFVAREDRLGIVVFGLLATPIRYLAVISDFVALLAFPFRGPPNSKSWQPAKL